MFENICTKVPVKQVEDKTILHTGQKKGTVKKKISTDSEY